ncbi:MAG: hypothetical protein PWP06_1365 [Candidatus Marinimicrobia bacterium]|jgi:hypothetical protein|nr:hypothetical protein [Candidatus Neomarinimicrobiota bacterium]
MLYLSLNPGLCTYVSSTEKDGNQVVEDAGKIPVSLDLNRSFFYGKDALAQLISLFKNLKESQNFPQHEISLSLPPSILMYAVNEEPVPDWMDTLRLGKDYSEKLEKKAYPLEKGQLTVWHDPHITDLILKAAENTGYIIKKITPGIINAINSVYMIYATDDYDKFTILKWDAHYPELVIFRNDVLSGYLCFANHESPCMLQSSGDVDASILEILTHHNITEKLYDHTGPLFVYSVFEPDSDPLQPFKKFGFCEIINPWTGLEVSQSGSSMFTDLTDTALSLWTESAGFINRE